MSLASRKSDLKNHLSRSTKKHLNLSDSATLVDDAAIDERRVVNIGDTAIAKIDLGERPSQERSDPPGAVMHRN
jgi:hypothetical protein